MKKLLMMIGAAADLTAKALAAAVSVGAMLPLLACADAVRVYDARDYVQSGLVGHFDAIRNVGYDKDHSLTATTWKNLANGPDAEFQYRAGSTPDSEWTANSYYFKEDAMATTVGTIDLGTNFTVQIAITADPSAQTVSTVGGVQDASSYNAWFNDNPKYNYGFWTSKAGTEITGNFNILAKSGTVRPKISSWGGRYVTWMLDGANSLCYTFETDEIPSGTELTVVSTKPAARKYCWGAEDKDGNGSLQAFLTGEYHSVRLYNRPLSGKEIAWNRKVDEARYRGESLPDTESVNVVLVSDATLGDCAEGWIGSYIVTGTHTFAAPPQAAFACTGYTLEKWNGSAWSAPETHTAERAYTYDSSSGAKVRVTWHWRERSALRIFDVGDYVQDGLILHFDGIRNAGADQPHEPDATAWANLVPGQPSASFVRADASYGEWRDSGFYFEGHDKPCGAWLDEAVSLGPNMTIQVAVSVDPLAQQSVKTNERYPMYFYGPSPDFGIYQGAYRGAANIPKQLTFKNRLTYSAGDGDTTIAEWDGMYASAILGGDSAYLTQSAGFENGVSRTPGNAASQRYSWGCGVNASGDCNENRAVIGTFHSVRVYGRALSESELAQNRVVDDARFRGDGGGAGSDAANVIIESTVPGLAGVDECGKYAAAAGYVFEAARTAIVDGSAYVLDGYTLETWDGAAWGAAARHDGETSYTATGAGLVRLTWLWSRTLRPVAGYDVGDYVQDSLVLHFDGIRNAGADAKHSNVATTWKNLAQSGHDATKTTLAKATDAWRKDGSWTGDGFVFGGKDYFAIDSALSLGNEVTVQSVIDRDEDSKTTDVWASVFGATSNNSDDFVIYYAKGSITDLYFKLFNTSAVKMQSTWSAPYVTAIYDGANSLVSIDKATLPAWKDAPDGVAGNLAAMNYAIGTGQNSDANKKARTFKGTYHSLRVYTKVLDEAELKQNRRVDEARFRGNGDVTIVNGAIGDTGMNGASSLPDGAYNIESGTWTVTAANVPVDGDGVYMPRLLVETWDEATGEWVADTTRPVWTESYTIDKAALGDSRIRLTWTWRKRIGLIISFH